MTCEEAQELITALADRELGEAEQGLLARHLEECGRCRVVAEEQRFLKTEIRSAGASLLAPARLRERILADRRIFPDKVESATDWRAYLWPKPHILRPVLITVLLLALTFSTLYLFHQTRESLGLAALQTYAPFVKEELSLIKAQSANEIEDKLVRAVNGRFHPMGYDLEAMNLKPVAGAVHEVRGRTILVAIYAGEAGSLLCYTFLGSEKDAPRNAATFFDPDKKMNFYAFSDGAVNAVLHRENDVICILAAEMPMEELLKLAKSKARPI